jgi:hypothetical protein
MTIIWKSTKLRVNKGSILPRDYAIPDWICQYLNDKADETARALASMSETQKQKIEDSLLENGEEYASSEVFRALGTDVQITGQKAFDITD